MKNLDKSIEVSSPLLLFEELRRVMEELETPPKDKSEAKEGNMEVKSEVGILDMKIFEQKWTKR